MASARITSLGGHVVHAHTDNAKSERKQGHDGLTRSDMGIDMAIGMAMGIIYLLTGHSVRMYVYVIVMGRKELNRNQRGFPTRVIIRGK